ncbi:MAG: DUF2231 domain-containing protein [Oscillochloridaceae bacterium umkhey_bin13]
MYALHPVTVHFPLGLLLASSLFSVLATRPGREGWAISAYHCLLVGWIASIVALLTGTADAVRLLTGPDAPRDPTLANWVNAHAFSNLAAVAVYGQALLRLRRQPNLLTDPTARRGYLQLHAIAAALLVLGGWLGGYLVYQLGVGVRI